MAEPGESPQPGGDRRRALLMGLLSALLFGMATPFSKELLAALHPNLLAGLLYLGAALFLSPVMILRRAAGGGRWPRDRSNGRRLLAAIFFGGILGPVLLLFGLRVARAASVAMWLNLETTATAVLAWLCFREHLGRWTGLGNLGVLAAGLLLGWEGGSSGFWGALLVGGAAICWGVDNNVTALIDGIGPAESTFWKGLVAGTTNLVAAAVLTGLDPSGRWIWALVLGGLSYGASISLYIASAQILGATRSQMVFATSPFFGVLLSVLWLKEGMSVAQWGAGALLVASLVMLFLDAHEHEHEHEATSHDHAHRHDDGHHGHGHDEAVDPARPHRHVHDHGAVRHRHPHWPDLHHRHVH